MSLTEGELMMTKLGAALIAGLMMFGLFGVVSASADPDPDGPAKKGLCTAYFNGQKNGHDKNGSPGPFAALEEAADAANGDDEENEDARLELAEDVFQFCDGLIGGNPEHGRFDCTVGAGEDGEEGTEDDTYTCEENDAPGNS